MSARDHELTLILQDLVGVLRAQAQGDVPLWRVNNWGDIIYGDSFEDNEIHWASLLVAGGTINREYSPQYVYHSNASIRANILGVANCAAGIQRYFSVPQDLSGVGFEYAFLTNTTNAEHRVSAWIFYYDGVTVWTGEVLYRPSIPRVEVIGATSVNIFPDVNRTNLVWQKCKITLDFVNQTFKNVFFNNVALNARNIALTAGASAVEPCIRFALQYYGTGANVTAGVTYFDDFMLTIKEPQL